ncbi:MAG TPA: Crp/Fnr family transcriptional regulator [Chloroflexota bacterium]|nr:Crp/Fnr family transcriptional regulator [Chloroflexota bacterium]
MVLSLEPSRNLLLADLPPEDLAQVTAKAEPVRFDLREPLYTANEPLSHVFFVTRGMVSVVRTTLDGGTVEVGPVGRDGMVGLPLFLDAESDPLHAFAQVLPCEAVRLDAATFRRVRDSLPELRGILGRYTCWTYSGMAQWVACARLHEAPQRMARWLLMCQDRVGGDTIPLTHEFLADMLGVRRPTVTLAAGTLQKAGLIRYSRGVVTILDRSQLEAAACECHRVSRDEYKRLFGRLPTG